MSGLGICAFSKLMHHHVFEASSGSLLRLLGDVGSDSVHISDTLLGEDFTSAEFLLHHLANKLSLLELLEAVSDDLTGRESGVLSASTNSLFRRVVLSEGLDTDLASHVELVSDGGSSDVEPVLLLWGEVLEAGSLVVDGPL